MFDLMTEPVQRPFRRLCIAGKHRRAEDVGAEQAAERGKAVDVGAFVAVSGVAAEGEQGGANVVPGGDRRMGIAEVIAEQVAAHRQLVVTGQAQQMPRQVIVVRPAGILHRHAHGMFAGMLARRDRRNVDADEFADVPR